MNPLLKLALDLGPLLVFFIGNSQFGIFPATGMFMVAMLLSMTASYVVAKRISPMLLVSGVVVLTFGGLTLWLADELFIKLKPTIVNSIFASVLFVGVLTDRLYIKFLFDNAFHLPDFAWKTLTWRWIVFFIFLAGLNEYIWRNYSTDFWVWFKLWGVVPISTLYGIAQMPYIMKHQLKDSEAETSEPSKAA